MILDRVTLTGADESVEPGALLALSKEFPFAEWGILVSKSQEGTPRFPHRAWIERLLSVAPDNLPLSLHVCGRWARDMMMGFNSIGLELGSRVSLLRFQRVQPNFHAVQHVTDSDLAATLLKAKFPLAQVIVQMDEVNNVLLLRFRGYGVDAVPLFDTSDGAGIVPDEWPRPLSGIPYHGYAGGLGPETVECELARIEDSAPGNTRIWIDMERRVRSTDDRQFALDKVRRVLELCAPHIAA